MTQPGRLAGVAEALGGIAEVVRRRRAAPPVVRLYDADDLVTTLDPETRQARDLIVHAERFAAAARAAGAPVEDAAEGDAGDLP